MFKQNVRKCDILITTVLRSRWQVDMSSKSPDLAPKIKFRPATIYQSLKKTDKEDALKLGRLIKRIPDNELPVVSLPSEKEEQARRLASENGFDKASRTRLINRLHSIFAREGITEVSKAELKNKTTRDKLISELNESNQKEATRLIEQIELLEK